MICCWKNVWSKRDLPDRCGFDRASRAPAETPVPDDFLCAPLVDSKRYSVDPSDSAFNVTASQYASKNPYSYRGSSCSLPGALCRRASSPARFHDGTRNGEFPVARCAPGRLRTFTPLPSPLCHLAYSPDSGECKRPSGKDPSSWGVEEVVSFIKGADPQALGPHTEAFRKHVRIRRFILAIHCCYTTESVTVWELRRETPADWVFFQLKNLL